MLVHIVIIVFSQLMTISNVMESNFYGAVGSNGNIDGISLLVVIDGILQVSFTVCIAKCNVGFSNTVSV